MRILITGGAGFIGSHLAEYWSTRGEVVVLDNLRTGFRENLESIPHTFVEGDVGDSELVERLMRSVDVVFHLAALVSVPESVEHPELCVRENVLGTLNVLKAALKEVSRVIFASSAAIYGDNPVVPKMESMLPEPCSPYAITKLDGEHYLTFYARQFGLSCAALRFFNVFGPRQNPSGPYASAVPVFVSRSIKNEEIRIYGDGEQTRDFIYVKDIVGALSFLAEKKSVSGVFNAGYGESRKIGELAEDIVRRTASDSSIKNVPVRPGDVKHSYASADKLLDEGWVPRWRFAEALEETIAYYQEKIERGS